jgi:hypothetical protein
MRTTADVIVAVTRQGDRSHECALTREFGSASRGVAVLRAALLYGSKEWTAMIPPQRCYRDQATPSGKEIVKILNPLSKAFVTGLNSGQL